MDTLSVSTRMNRLSKVFEDWQLMVLSKLPDGTEAPKGSRILSDETNDSLREDFSGRGRKSISRASVINFLTKLSRMSLIEGVDAVGKGGTRHDYRYVADRHFFNVQVASMLLGAIIEEYPDVDVPWTMSATPDMLAKIATS